MVGKEAIEGSSISGSSRSEVGLAGVGRGGEVDEVSGSVRSSIVRGGRSKKSAARGRVKAVAEGCRGGGVAFFGAGAEFGFGGSITEEVLTGMEGCRVGGMLWAGVWIMFAISGGIAGDGVVGFTGEVGTVGTGVLPQASRNRRISASLASGGGEKLGGEGARGDRGFWVSGKVRDSNEPGDVGGGVDSGRHDGGEDVDEVDRVSAMDGLVGS